MWSSTRAWIAPDLELSTLRRLWLLGVPGRRRRSELHRPRLIGGGVSTKEMTRTGQRGAVPAHRGFAVGRRALVARPATDDTRPRIEVSRHPATADQTLPVAWKAVRKPMTHRDPDIDVTHALEAVTVPAYVVDRQGRIRWLNRGAIDIFGDRVGQPFARVVAPEDAHLARTNFARKLIGETGAEEYNLTLLALDGRRVSVRVSSVPIWEGGEIIGVFGLAYPAGVVSGGEMPAKPAAAAPELTARQYETLALLADGLGTAAIALRLGVAEDTARNHIRALLRQFGVHTRLEAVVRAYRLGLLQPRRED